MVDAHKQEIKIGTVVCAGHGPRWAKMQPKVGCVTTSSRSLSGRHCRGFRGDCLRSGFLRMARMVSASGDSVRDVVFHLRDGLPGSRVENVDMMCGVRRSLACRSRQWVADSRSASCWTRLAIGSGSCASTMSWHAARSTGASAASIRWSGRWPSVNPKRCVSRNHTRMVCFFHHPCAIISGAVLVR